MKLVIKFFYFHVLHESADSIYVSIFLISIYYDVEYGRKKNSKQTMNDAESAMPKNWVSKMSE